MWANAACTERPVVGQSYETLYVRLNRAFGLGDSKVWGNSDEQGSALNILCPNEEAPSDPYSINLYIDFLSDDLSSAFIGGQIVEVTSGSPVEINSSFVFDFYDD